jgi:hypothetical protein
VAPPTIYQPHPITSARVVLTTAHLDHHPPNCDPANLRAWCQRCHNRYDAAHRAGTRARAMRGRFRPAPGGSG